MEGEEPKVDPPAEEQPEMEAPAAEGDPAMEGMDAEMEGAPAEEGASPDAQPVDAMEGEMEEEMEPQEDFSQDTSKYIIAIFELLTMPGFHPGSIFLPTCNFIILLFHRIFGSFFKFLQLLFLNNWSIS